MTSIIPWIIITIWTLLAAYLIISAIATTLYIALNLLHICNQVKIHQLQKEIDRITRKIEQNQYEIDRINQTASEY